MGPGLLSGASWAFQGAPYERDFDLRAPDSNPKPPGPKPTINHVYQFFQASTIPRPWGSRSPRFFFIVHRYGIMTPFDKDVFFFPLGFSRDFWHKGTSLSRIRWPLQQQRRRAPPRRIHVKTRRFPRRWLTVWREKLRGRKTWECLMSHIFFWILDCWSQRCTPQSLTNGSPDNDCFSLQVRLYLRLVWVVDFQVNHVSLKN